jgi:hypothetical protein
MPQILEGQKDPPREKLFSVLGKIFKVTERNQASPLLARPSVHDNAQLETSAVFLHEEMDDGTMNQEVHDTSATVTQDEPLQRKQEEEVATTAVDDKRNLVEPSLKCEQVELPSCGDNNASEGNINSVGTTRSSISGIPRCPSPDVAVRPRGSKTWRAGDELIGSTSVVFRSRYPSTMHSWDLGSARKSIGAAAMCESIDFTAQWNELNALSASFSAT